MSKKLVVTVALALGISANAQTAEIPSLTLSNINPSQIATQRYEKAKPQWGIELLASGNFGSRSLTTSTSTGQSVERTGLFSAAVDFQPKPLQKYGVFGLGPTFTAYPDVLNHGSLEGLKFAWSAGAQVRYQLRYFKNQFFVPVVGYSAEMFSYKLRTGEGNSFFARGPSAGGWFLLNALDHDAARRIFESAGLVRSYLTAEVKALSGSDPVAKLGGTSYQFGLRVEF